MPLVRLHVRTLQVGFQQSIESENDVN